MNILKKILTSATIGLILTACSAQVTPPTAPVVEQVTVKPILADSIATTQPAPEKPALPPGHPNLSQLQAQPGDQQLPPGHPKLPSNQPGQPGLPAGHPMVPSLSPSTMPGSTQPSVQGELNIHAIQKTAGAAAVGADKVAIELYFNGQLWDQTNAELTADGTFKVVGLPVKFGIQPVVKITHAGTVFSVVGDVMDAEHAKQSLDVPIYETVDKAPDWSVVMRHVMVQPSPTGVEVVEMLAIQCAGDRAWKGDADAAGKRTTLSLPLPEGATDIKVSGGLSSDTVTFDNGVLHSSQPIIPGEDRYQVQYTIPARDNQATLSVSATVPMGHVMMFVPEDGTTVTPTAPLKLMGSQQMGEKGPKTRYFLATQVGAGQKLSLVISDLKSAGTGAMDTSEPAPDTQEAAATPAASKAPKLLTIIGSCVVLGFGAVLLLIKTPRQAASKKNQKH